MCKKKRVTSLILYYTKRLDCYLRRLFTRSYNCILHFQYIHTSVSLVSRCFSILSMQKVITKGLFAMCESHGVIWFVEKCIWSLQSEKRRSLRIAIYRNDFQLFNKACLSKHSLSQISKLWATKNEYEWKQVCLTFPFVDEWVKNSEGCIGLISSWVMKQTLKTWKKQC